VTANPITEGKHNDGKTATPTGAYSANKPLKKPTFNKLLELTAEITRLLDQREECLESLG